MQKWEELAYERQEGLKEGIERGMQIFIKDNLSEGRTRQQIIDKLIAAYALSKSEAEECSTLERILDSGRNLH